MVNRTLNRDQTAVVVSEEERTCGAVGRNWYMGYAGFGRTTDHHADDP